MTIRSAPVLLVLGFSALACSEEDPAPKESLAVGFAHPFTGPLATQGVTFEQAIRLAQKQINDGGGLRGKQLELLDRDTQTNGDVATAVSQELVASGVPAIVSGDGTASAMAMLGVTVPAHTVLVVGTAQTVALARPENNGLFFRPGSTTSDEAGPLAAAIAADGVSKLAVISSMIPYASSLYGEFEKAFLAASCRNAPCTITHHNTYAANVDPATFDFSPLVAEALASNPEAIFLASYPGDGKALFNAVWVAGYRGPLYTTAAAGNENLTPFLPEEQAAKIKWVTMDDAAGPSAEFVRSIWVNSGFRPEDFFGPVHSNFDAMFVLGLALAHANSTDGEAIAASMRTVANPPGQQIYANEWAKALTLIQAGEDIDYVGVVGNIDFDELGNNREIVSVVKGYQNGQPVILSRE